MQSAPVVPSVWWGLGDPGDQLLVQRVLQAAGEGSPPGNEGKGSIFFLTEISYIPCAFDLKKSLYAFDVGQVEYCG